MTDNQVRHTNFLTTPYPLFRIPFCCSPDPGSGSRWRIMETFRVVVTRVDVSSPLSLFYESQHTKEGHIFQ